MEGTLLDSRGFETEACISTLGNETANSTAVLHAVGMEMLVNSLAHTAQSGSPSVGFLVTKNVEEVKKRGVP